MTFRAMKFRVESPAHSEKIQKVLFDMGYTLYGKKGEKQEPVSLDLPYLYAYADGDITSCTHGFHSGNKKNWQEYTLKEIISYELVPVPTQKPGELIELNGLKYKRAELEEALKLIKPVE